MIKNIIPLIALYWLAACNNADHTTEVKIDDQLAEKIVRDYMHYKNTAFDGAGTTKAETITILSKKQVLDTVWIKYSWSGKYREAPTRNNYDSTFSSVNDMAGEAKAVKVDSLWQVQ